MRYLLIRPPLEEVFPLLPEFTDRVIYKYMAVENAIEYGIPYGLLKIANYLQIKGHEISFHDFGPWSENPLEVNYHEYGHRHPGMSKGSIRYPVYLIGKSLYEIKKTLEQEKEPDEIYITTSMTFHADSVSEMTKICREIFPNAKITIGGIYASLCPEHAKKNSEIDNVFIGPFWDADDFDSDISMLGYDPGYYMYKSTRGCPNRCSYCAVHMLEGKKMVFRDPKKTAEEIINAHRKMGIRRFVASESNLLVNSKNHFEKILDMIIESKIDIRLEAPEGLAPKLLTPGLLKKMHKAGYRKLNIPLESANDKTNLERFHRSTTIDDFEKAIADILDAGFNNNDLGVYCLIGMPGHELREQVMGIIKIWKMGLMPFLTFFTPIPGTEEYENNYHLIKHKSLSELHPHLFPFAGKEFSVRDMEDMFCLMMSMHALERMQYLRPDSRVRTIIFHELERDICFRRATIQHMLYGSISKSEADIISSLLKIHGMAQGQGQRDDEDKPLLIHYYMKDYEKKQQEYNPPFIIKNQLCIHKEFTGFIKSIQEHADVTAEPYMPCINGSGRASYKRIVDLFSLLYMTDAEISDYLEKLHRNKAVNELTLRLWNKDTADQLRKNMEFQDNTGKKRCLIAQFNRDDIKTLLKEHGFMVSELFKTKSFGYAVAHKEIARA
ncbi:radical SAM protein [Candidatus Woesearchaeota archaeon]|nr:radical SAM protein [Candidatus Woesearchaeota archaeon]